MSWILALLLLAVGAWLFEARRRKRHPVAAGFQQDIAIPHDQAFELYHNAFSLCSMKTRVCLAELGVPYASHHVDLIETGGYENIRAGFLALNPAGTVPVLVHEGHPIYESHEQIRYAALHAPAGGPSLVPDDPVLRAEMERWVDLSSLTEDPIEHGDETAGNAVPGLTLPLFASMIEKIPAWRIAEGFLFHFDKRRPLMFFAFKLAGFRRFARLGAAPAILARSRRQMEAHLDALEAKLGESGGPWILGESFSLADVGWLVILERLRQADVEHVFMAEGRRPACAAYWARLQARDSHRQAIRAHAHPLVGYGTRRIQDVKAADPALRRVLEGS